MNAEDWGAVSTWTDVDELERRIANVEALVNTWKQREDQRGRIVGTRIALAIVAVGYSFLGFALWWALQ